MKTNPSIEPILHPRRSLLSLLLLPAAFLLAHCSDVPHTKTTLTQNRELEAFETIAAYPSSDARVVLVAMQEFIASKREWEGYDYFGKLAEQQPQRRAFFLALQGVMQARVAADVPLLKRVAWVESAIEKLDQGVAADPVLGRFARGSVFAELPARFGKAHDAVADLTSCLEHRAELPVALDRGIYRALAAAYRTLGDEARSRDMLARAGLATIDDPAVPRILTNESVDGVDGFRFVEKRFVQEADGVFVAEGYDFSNLAFLVADRFVVAIDAGTTERSARGAVTELRKHTSLPIKYIILTHGHWDHVGGLGALREPGTIVLAQSRFPAELARSRSYPQPFRYFFGSDPIPLDVTPDRLLDAPETLEEGGLDLALFPAPSGETDDALFVFDKKHRILFVGDAFMPYIGAPVVAEGSPRGLVDAAALVDKLDPRRVIHGHPPLTEVFTREAMPGLALAARELYDHALAGARAARPLADVLHDDFIPESLRSSPKAALPFLVMHDTFIQRVYQEEAGYWQTNGDGVDHFTRAEWAGTLDLLGGHSDGSFARTVDDLVTQGDATMALRIADIGLVRYPASESLRAGRAHALTMLKERYAPINPFRFILYSEWSNQPFAALEPGAMPDRAPAAPTPASTGAINMHIHNE
jgi:glyoxylase-like metal-dependent hydrolase (beta-lactamase superfamily II)